MFKKLRLLLLLLVTSCLHANAQGSLVINGPSSVCKESLANYSLATTPGFNYQWSVSGPGTIAGYSAGAYINNSSVQWGNSGSGTVKVRKMNAAGVALDSGQLSVTITPSPQPYITQNAQVGCQDLSDPRAPKEGIESDDEPCLKACHNGVPVQYTAHGQSGSTFSWEINFPGQATQYLNGATVSVSWPNLGVGSIKLTETNSNGCRGTKIACVKVIESPKADFFPELKGDACLEQNVLFTDISSDNGGSAIIERYWDFGDSTYLTTTATSVSHAYSTPGTKRVTLTVRNKCNCTSTKSYRIEVKEERGPQIFCPTVTCEENRERYYVEGPCKGKWIVDGGSIINNSGNEIYVNWQAPSSGFGTVTFIPVEGCEYKCLTPTKVSVPVVLKNARITGPNYICAGKRTLFSLPQWPSTDFNWTVSNPSSGVNLIGTGQRNEILVEAPPGTGSIILNCSYYNTLRKCEGNASIQIYVTSPTAIVGPLKACRGLPYTYTLSSGAPANWVMTSPTGGVSTVTFPYQFPSPGVYTLAATGNFCEPTPIQIEVVSPPRPPIDINGPDYACPGTPTLYKGISPTAGQVFLWSVSSGSVNGVSGPSTYATFSGAPPYTITLSKAYANMQECVSGSISKTVYAPPFSPSITTVPGGSSVCASSTTNYSANITDGQMYTWSVSPSNLGSIASGNGTPTASVIWNEIPSGAPTAAANVVLTIRKCGKDSTVSFPVTVNGIPQPVINDSNLCAGSATYLSINASNIASVVWHFGDGHPPVTSSGSNTSHNYNVAGSSPVSFTVSATVTYGLPCPRTIMVEKVITINPSPVAYLSFDGTNNFCPPQTPSVQLNLTNSSPVGAPFTYTWNYNGTPITPAPNGMSYTATNFGSYTVTVMNNFGCKKTTNNVGVYSLCDTCFFPVQPNISLTASQQSCNTVTAQGFTTGSNPTWITGPNSNIVSSTNSSATIEYSEPGEHTISYSAYFPNTTGGMCPSSASKKVIIPFIPQILWDATCNNGMYQLKVINNTKVYSTYAPNSYIIKIDNIQVYSGNTLNSITALANYGPGTHNIQLIVSLPGFSACTTNVNAVLPDFPQANFTTDVSNACVQDKEVLFFNSSTPTTGVSYLWNFGDGASNILQNPVRVYSQVDTFTPTLKVTNTYGCSSTAQNTINILADQLNGTLIASPQPACAGSTATVTYSGSSQNPTQLTWLMNGQSIVMNSNLSYSVGTSGLYGVRVSNAIGCRHTPQPIAVSFTEIPDPIIYGKSSQCANTAYTLDGYAGSGNYTYEWYVKYSNSTTFTLLSSSSISSHTELYPNIGTHIYRLVIKVPQGNGTFCSKTSADFPVTVYPNPNMPVIGNPTALSCNPYKLQLTATVSGAGNSGTFTWNNGFTGSPITVHNGGHYQVWYTDTNGCVSTNSEVIPRDPKSYLWIFPTGCIEACEKDLPLTILGPSTSQLTGWAYFLNGNVAQSGNSGPVPPYSIQSPGSYTLSLSNGLCGARSEPLNVTTGGKDCEEEPVPCHPKNFIQLDRVRCVNSNTWAIYVTFYNATSANYNYQITSSGGTVLNPSGVFGPGSNSLNVTLTMPSYAPSVTLYVTFYDPKTGIKCTLPLEVGLPLCAIPGRMAGDTTKGNMESQIQSALLTAAPNPAKDQVKLFYQLPSEYSGKDGNAIQIFDMSGRLVREFALRENTGSIEFVTDFLQNGLYLVNLKSGGVSHSRLQLTIVK